MQIVIAMDSFKGSLSSPAAGEAVAAGVRRVFPEADCRICPLADGGEGTAAALTQAMGGIWVHCRVAGPRLTPVDCAYGIVGQTAILDSAAAAGLTLLPPAQRDPRLTTTYGLGQAIAHAMAQGCRRFLLGLGGSATNDAGAGMLQALGFTLRRADGSALRSFGGAALAEVCTITTEHVLPELAECEFLAACDVTTPLCGPAGCSAVFGPQKGASPAAVAELDAALQHFARCAARLRPEADPQEPGSGAAGGLGFALRCFLNARLEPGAALVLRETGLEAHLRRASLVFTGEGRLDAQTALGKGPAAVAQLAARHGRPCIALAGSIHAEAEALFTACFPIQRGVCTLDEAMQPQQAVENLSRCAEQVCRLLAASRDFSVEI